MTERSPSPCPECGRENEAGQLFCGSCGTRLLHTCLVCGAASPVDFRFCGSCGAELGPDLERSGEERRVVSVLFADLVGFTSRAESLDPEDVRAILTPYYARLRDEIEAYGGTVEKFIGDAVMGVFGAPVAYGDDPERAVRAALGIRSAVDELNDADPELDLRVRIAVNTGEAIVTLGARPREGEAMVAGDVVNTAARLQAAAPVDSILVGEETYRCTRTTVEYEQVEPVVAKGKQAPVAAWRALAAAHAPGERISKGVEIVGREHELTSLSRIWESVVAERHAHLVTVFGPPGVGKSRLAAELMGITGADGGLAIRGRSLPYGESGPYGPFAQQLKQVAGIFDSDPPALAAQKLRRSVGDLVDAPDLDDVVSHIALLMGLETEGDVTDRHILFFSARRLVGALATGRPLLLVFEDLHWAEPSLLDLLELLASRIREAPLLLLTLARRELLDGRPRWGGGLPAYTALQLEPLGDEQSRELAMRLFVREGEELPSHDAAEHVAEVGEGNPLFIEELVASLTERPAARPQELPTSIRGIVAARLDALPPGERSVLLAASVLGKIFWRGALARLGAEDERLGDVLDSLEARDFIRREPVSRIQGDEQFRFKHVLIRDIAYATLPRARRREAHAAVAAFLEEMTAESDSAAFLAHHWREAGERERAVEYFLVAAEQASRGWAKEEAVGLYNEALALVAPNDLERRRAIRLKRAVDQQMLFHLLDVERLDRGGAPSRAEDYGKSSGEMSPPIS
jgi:class 3 adenylate cyclase